MADPRDLVDALGDAARTASHHAWCPHSGFRVGAALRDIHGEVHVGCNVESDSYGLTQCAERNAIGAAAAAGRLPGEFDALVIFVPGDRAWPPCGACRQVITEALPANARVVSFSERGEAREWRVSDLLPEAFSFATHGPSGAAGD